MSRGRFIHWLIGMSLTVTAPALAADPSATGQSLPTEPTYRYERSAVYDMAPAMGRAAFADAEYDRAYSALVGTLAQAKLDFVNSPDYIAAKREASEAGAAYDSAREAVLSKLLNNAEYRAAVEKHTEADIALKSNVSPRIQSATNKMEIGSYVTQLQAAALATDANFQSAKTRLTAAQDKLNALQYQYQAKLSSQSAVVAARQSYDTARSLRAGAEGYLAGAFITRDDAIDADNRRYPPQPVYLYGGMQVGYWNPYYLGYYHLGPGGF